MGLLAGLPVKAWALIKDAVLGFIEHDALSRGASIAYYTLLMLVPVLLIVIAVAGIAFGREAAQGAIVAQMSGLMGAQSAEALQAMIESASRPAGGTVAALLGLVATFLAVTGVFGELQSALNLIWNAKSRRSSMARLVRARFVSLGLVVIAGFLLMVSLAISAGLAALSAYLKTSFPGIETILGLIEPLISVALTASLFAAMYKVLPDTPIAWSDVIVGALVTTALFQGGKYLIAFYIGQSDVASSYGAAGALIVVLLWIYYTGQIFLLGAEFTHAFAKRYGSLASQDRSGGPAGSGLALEGEAPDTSSRVITR